MKTVQMTLDEELIAQVDHWVKRLKTTRSAFARKALRKAVEEIKRRGLEEKQRRGYEKHPVRKEEFGGWGKEQVWVE